MRPTAARQGSLREHNLGLVLRTVLESDASPSRADVAAATGLTKATVSALVDRLVAGGLLAELAPAPALRAGRPAVPLAAPVGTVAALGAEVNVDYLGVRVLDLSGAVLHERLVHGDYRSSDPATVLARLAGLVDEAAAATSGTRLAGTALALPGLVDRGVGPLRLAPNLGWRDVGVVTLLAASSDVLAAHPPALANEADLAARAEAAARREDPTFVYVSGEVGIGAAVVLDGRILAGRHGWAGELGHTLVADGRPLESVAGQDAMLRAAGMDPVAGIDALAAAADDGDEAALRAIGAAGDLLGQALANVVNLLDISDVVLGGSYARLATHLREPVLAALGAHVLAAPWAPPTVDVARAASVPALDGAALTVLAGVIDDPSAWLAPEVASP